jgi:(p)ppGpp synthase/HD superfamily hydrolase
MNQLNHALLIAIAAQKGQKDKAGYDYINHPVYLALQMDTEDEKIVALLHDVVEDTDWDFAILKENGFDEHIIEAIECLTRKQAEDYFSYIARVKQNKLAAKIKLAELVHNSDLSRIERPSKTDFERIEKYKKAIRIITDQ